MARLAYLGTPDMAVPPLRALVAAGHDIALCVTRPDRRRGRGKEETPSPVKVAATELGLPVTHDMDDLTTAGVELAVVVAYGRIIPPWMLALPRLGCINLHASLLPKYRGAAPIQWAIANGDAFTGNTTMLLEEGLDTGPILLQQTHEIGPEQTAVDLFEMLARAGAPLVVETLAGLADGTIHPRPQNQEHATFAPLLDREDGRMDFALRSAHELYNRWRGFQPWPGAFTTLGGKKLIVHRLAVAASQGIHSPHAAHSGAVKPGQIRIESHRIFAACAADTWLELIELQLEGKKRLAAAEFLHGTQLRAGSRLGTPNP